MARSAEVEQVRAAEVLGCLSLATDLGMGLPLEHGLRSTIVGMRLADRLEVDEPTAQATYYGCLLYYIGCTADADVAATLFSDGGMHTHFDPVIFGRPSEIIRGIARAVVEPNSPPLQQLSQLSGRLPRAMRGYPAHVRAICEVAQMLCRRVALPENVTEMFGFATARWDGHGRPARPRGDGLPLALRIVHVARDATLQHELGGVDYAARVIRSRRGGAFDPAVADCVADAARDILRPLEERSVWEGVLALEPTPRLHLSDAAVDEALRAMGDFADLVSPRLTGHSSAVATLAERAARLSGCSEEDVTTVRRAGFVHDLGRVALPARIWDEADPLSADDWENVRLHPYHSERVLLHSAALVGLVPAAAAHHERTDGSGYHRGATAASLPRTARLVAAADMYRTKTEDRPHRPRLSPAEAAAVLAREADQGRQDGTAVAAVLEAAGHTAPPVRRPAGLTEREAQVLGLLARGLQTKHVARVLGISVKTADRHVQNAYAKAGVSTRASATLFAMEHGLTAWGELPMASDSTAS